MADVNGHKREGGQANRQAKLHARCSGKGLIPPLLELDRSLYFNFLDFEHSLSSSCDIPQVVVVHRVPPFCINLLYHPRQHSTQKS